MEGWSAPFSLQGIYVSVEPLSHDHHDDLCEATADGQLHKLWYTMIPDADGMAAEIDRRLALSNMLPFAIIDNASGKAVGMTTYMNIDEPNKRLEIGSNLVPQIGSAHTSQHRVQVASAATCVRKSGLYLR